MMEPWNDASIQPPPVNTSEAIKSFDVAELSHACKSIRNVLTKQSPLHKEAAVVSRFLYKFDKKFRNDIGYRNLRKVNTALHRYLTINLLKVIENFTSVLPKDSTNYLPTRQMLEYVLVRIMTFSKVMVRICVCSKQAAVFYLDRVKRGESHWMCLMPYALLSRVWAMSTVLLQHSISWYTSLHKFLNMLSFKGIKFLPNNYSLPEHIMEWLDMENLDNFGRLEWFQKKQTYFGQHLEDDNVFDSILGYVNDINNEDDSPQVDNLLPDIEKQIEFKVEPVREMDQGVAISRESYILSRFKNNLQHETNTHLAEKVTSMATLKEFIDKEETFRREGSNWSLTQHISLMQWHALKNSLLNICDSLSNNRKIERKFQKIWKERCLDYA